CFWIPRSTDTCLNGWWWAFREPPPHTKPALLQGNGFFFLINRVRKAHERHENTPLRVRMENGSAQHTKVQYNQKGIESFMVE
ncbi:hypothetical protein ACQP3D_29575, partial [Escherichia coli]